MTGFLKAAQINNWHVGVCRPIFMPHSLDIVILAQSQLPSFGPLSLNLECPLLRSGTSDRSYKGYVLKSLPREWKTTSSLPVADDVTRDV